MRNRFDSIYSHGMIRVGVCLPSLRVASPDFNLERTLDLARQASKANVAVALFPELGISLADALRRLVNTTRGLV